MKSTFSRPRFLSRSCAVVLALSSLALSLPARAVDREALRRAVPLPRVSVGFAFAFAPPGSPKVSDEEAARQIDALKNASTPQELDRRGQLLRQLKRNEEAKAAYAQAARGWSEQLKARPDDAKLLVSAGLSLDAAGQNEEAEARLRRAVEVAPRDPEAWDALGKVLLAKSNSTLFPRDVAFRVEDNQFEQTKGIAEAMQQRPSDEAIALGLSSLEQARAAYDRAVEVAPKDGNAYANRVGFRMGEGFARGFWEALRADVMATRAKAFAAGAQSMMQGMMSPAQAPDLRQRARLEPDDAQALGGAAMFEFLRVLTDEKAAGRQVEITQAMPLLSTEARESVRFAMERLQVLAGSETPAAAEASEALGILQYMGGQGEAAEKSLRRSLKLDPSREQAWGLLANILRESNRFGDMAALLEEQVRFKDTVQKRLILAFAYDKLSQPQRVAEHVSAALKQNPDDIDANLAQAAVLMRTGESLTQAGQQLQRAARLFAPPAEPTKEQKTSFATLRGLGLGLSGEVEAARAQLQAVQKSDANNEPAQKALAALDR